MLNPDQYLPEDPITNDLQDVKDSAEDNKAIKTLLAQVHELAVLPHVVFKVLELSGSTDNPTSEMERAITVDPGFSSKVLILANSAAFALPRKVTSIREALMFLGYKAVRQVAMTVGVYDLFVGKNDRESLRRRAWWRHSVDTAVCARWLAESTRKVSPDDAYTCGLLHLIGKTLLDRLGGEDYKLVEETTLFGVKDYKAEEAIYGCNHIQVATAAAQKWGLANELISGMNYVHPAMDDDPFRCHRAATALATNIAKLAVEGAHHDQEALRMLPAWALETLEIPDEKVAGLVDGGTEAITKWKVQI
jgi:HD-like signal output (HDOD) protein